MVLLDNFPFKNGGNFASVNEPKYYRHNKVYLKVVKFALKLSEKVTMDAKHESFLWQSHTSSLVCLDSLGYTTMYRTITDKNKSYKCCKRCLSNWALPYNWVMRLCHAPDGSTSPKISCCVLNHLNLFNQIQNVLAFNQDMCCHLVLCLRLLPFHCPGMYNNQLRYFMVVSQ